ncbi:hypothetical protein OAE41_00240 [bacterium]|nr:hypothetical protein [bacterium]
MILDLKNIINSISSLDYVIVKLSPAFPNYSPGSDIDIFSTDPDRVLSQISAQLNSYVCSNQFVRFTQGVWYYHLDFIVNQRIDFRFDICFAMPIYKRCNAKEFYFSKVIFSGVKVMHNDVILKVPSNVDECVLRYLEYNEYFALLPNKIKHAEFINNKFLNSATSFEEYFYDYLNYVISFPPHIPKTKKLGFIISYLKSLRFYGKKIRSAFMTGGMSLVLSKINQFFSNKRKL